MVAAGDGVTAPQTTGLHVAAPPVEPLPVAPVPGALAERVVDERYGVPVPFACGHDDGSVDHGSVVKRRAIQCALSRVCGLCGTSLTWGVTFVGSPEEASANGFHLPPLHRACAEAALGLYPALGVPVLGQRDPLDVWALVVTGGFELVRPATREGDQRVAFRPNSVTEERWFHVGGQEPPLSS